MLKFDESQVTYTIEPEVDDLPLKGNVLMSGNDVLDRAAETAVQTRLDNGEMWAWASVLVVARYNDIEMIDGCAHLGGCNYRDEADFKSMPEYADMKATAMRKLKEEFERIMDILS